MIIIVYKVVEIDMLMIIFFFDYYFLKDECIVEVSLGKWEISSDEEEFIML